MNQIKKENITHSIQTIRKNKTIEHCKQQQKQPKISIIILSACVWVTVIVCKFLYHFKHLRVCFMICWLLLMLFPKEYN